MDRRHFLQDLGGALVATAGMRAAAAGLPQGTLESSLSEQLPGKDPLIKRAYRPPNFETPVEAFDEVLTPNRQFFVRFHLANIPTVDARTWRLRIGGEAAGQPRELGLEELQRRFAPAEVVAVCQCSGNRRGLSDPHVTGVQWGYGAMGNARWKGARLRDVLALAQPKASAMEVAFDGADSPVLEKTPDFVKSLPLWKAMDEHTLIAWEMNGEPLPHWNGFPVRLVVPGWTGTYWVKMLTSIELLAKPFAGFWMNPAYRIPQGKFPVVDRFVSQENATTMPITEMVVNSLITSPRPGARLAADRPLTVRGVAWDGGYGIRTVDVSLDGVTWQAAELGSELGPYSFRPWRFSFTPRRGVAYVLSARASNRAGATQTQDLIFNPAGYHNNVVERVEVKVS